MSRIATMEEARDLMLELSQPSEPNDSKKRQFERALGRIRDEEPVARDKLTPSKAVKLWRGYFDRFELLAHEYRAIVAAISKQARAQDARIAEALLQSRKRGLQELEKSESERAEIDLFLSGRKGRVVGGRSANRAASHWQQASRPGRGNR